MSLQVEVRIIANISGYSTAAIRLEYSGLQRVRRLGGEWRWDFVPFIFLIQQNEKRKQQSLFKC
jgi:hypothetical protein